MLIRRVLSGLRWLARVLDPLLPSGPDAGNPDGRNGEPQSAQAARRQERIRLRMKEKAGKGGYR